MTPISEQIKPQLVNNDQGSEKKVCKSWRRRREKNCRKKSLKLKVLFYTILLFALYLFFDVVGLNFFSFFFCFVVRYLFSTFVHMKVRKFQKKIQISIRKKHRNCENECFWSAIRQKRKTKKNCCSVGNLCAIFIVKFPVVHFSLRAQWKLCRRLKHSIFGICLNFSNIFNVSQRPRIFSGFGADAPRSFNEIFFPLFS